MIGGRHGPLSRTKGDSRGVNPVSCAREGRYREVAVRMALVTLSRRLARASSRLEPMPMMVRGRKVYLWECGWAAARQ